MKTSSPNSFSRFTPAAFVLLCCFQLNAKEVKRFYPEALQQDGKITLSPGFSPDGKTIYFAQSECSPIWKCPQRLKKSVFINEGWSKPIPVPLPIDARTDWPTVTPDGQSLVFSWSAPRDDYQNLDIYENFDLYMLDLSEPDSIPQPIFGADINRPRAGEIKKRRFFHNESLPSITQSGDLYFMTERVDGFGERDLYVAKAGVNGMYKTAVPLPAPINSKERDDGIWVDPTGTIMLLSYPNRGGEGGPDLFISVLKGGDWIVPRNLGPHVNSSFAEFGARITPDKKSIVFTSDRPFAGQEAGLLQVWVAEIPQDILNLIATNL